MLAADRRNKTEFLFRQATGSIPAGTRSVRLALSFAWTAGATTDGYAQDLSLTVSPAVPMFFCAPA